MSAPVSDAWISEGCAKARDLLAQGLTNQAADVLRYVEVRALELSARERKRRYERRARERGCSVRGCTTNRLIGSRPWCFKHAVRFDRDPRMVAA